MKTKQIEAEKIYEITIGKNKTTVKVLAIERRVNGQLVFDCLNIKTDKRLTVSDPKRFLREIKTEKPARATSTAKTKIEHPGGKKVSGLEAAYIVLSDAAEPLNIRQIMERINDRGLAHLAGKTPDATVSAAMQREIARKLDASRFVKAGKGLFAAR
ncbi:MAG: winged helix-turn-helix domain-containing protein [Planctomycetaceae bacterium]|jgi:hypothetical protein|nr:winged helix-turn-helix domain-containing protein [Planctomycetaceae bacterium]